MNNTKKRVSLLLAVIMIALAIFPLMTSVASSDSPYISMSVKLNGKELENGKTYKVQGNEKILVNSSTTYPNAKIHDIAYYFEDMTDIKEVTSSSATIIVPTAKPGTTSRLCIETLLDVDNGQPNTETKTGWQIYTLVWDEVESISLDVDLKYGSKVLATNSTTNVKVGDKLNVVISPLNNAKTIYYRVDAKNSYNLDADKGTLTIPAYFDDGQPHRIDIVVRDVNGKDTPTQTYYFIVEAPTEADFDDELDILPWEKECKDLDQLAVSLRNDSEEEDKANKNIYALDELVTYFVDYKNGGKDIKLPVELKLELPLNFDVVSADGGKVDKNKGTITWNFANGLEAEQAGTKEVKIKYTSFDRKSTDQEIIYPMATIAKDGKIQDESSVINMIYRDSDTVLTETHVPFMYGDGGKTTFRPDEGITRAEGALVLTRVLLGQSAIDNVVVKSLYPDLNETYLEAQKAIIAATSYGIINGYTDGYYRPNEKMTRSEFMKILAKFIELDAEDNGIKGLSIKETNESIKLYKDPVFRYVVNGQTVSEHWAIEEVSLLARLNMTPVSKSNKNLRLDEEITRAEVAQLVNFYSLRAPAEVTSKTVSGFSDVNKKHELFADIIEATRKAHDYTITEEATEIAEK